LTLVAGGGYFFVWTLLGLAAYAVGVALAAIAMEVPAIADTVPIATALVVLAAGAVQFTSWKARHLACCRDPHMNQPESSATAGTAWRHGLRLGLHCSYCCAGPMAILLALGVMDLRAMAIVTVAITAERLAPAGGRVARALGVVVLAAGVLMIVRAAGVA
jgi:predicted metal-binding membrane protein